MKIVINRAWGGFEGINDNDKDRTSPEVIAAALINDEWDIIEIPDMSYYEIIDYDGMERIVWSREPLYSGQSVKDWSD